MNLNLKGKVFLVQGSSQGIGFAVAKRLFEEGAMVALCARSRERLENARAQILKLDPTREEDVGCIAEDFSKPNAAYKAISRTQELLKNLHGVVMNTGGPPKAPFLEVRQEQWHEQFQNLWMSVSDSIHAGQKVMRANGYGRFVLISSVAAKEPMLDLTISNGFRAGLLGLLKSVSTELAQYSITVNTVMPGFTDTERLRELKLTQERIQAIVPMKRLGHPDECADLVSFLCSDRAAYITGQAIAVDGGYLKGHS